MAYCTKADILEEGLTEQDIVLLCDDEKAGSGNEKIADRVSAAIAKADEEIDADLIEHYTVPFTTVPAIIKLISAKLAVRNLYNRRRGENPKNVEDEAKWARSKIKEYKNRASQLSTDDPKVGGSPKTNKTADDRQFTDDLLKKMP